uniref:Uncharacterized protein n=1 Tax=Avena sativa TaxID=4498 RepID=A0ACD6AS89_AVESA
MQASEIVKANNLTDKIVVIHGRVEDIEVEEKVDVIISEWMGYMLLYESMLPSVLFARDKWLKPGGLILPSHATLFMAPITNSDRYEGSVDFWCDVYGIDMSALVPLAKKFASEEPSIELIGGENVISWPFVVKHIDCYTFTVEEFKSVAATYKVSSMVLAPIHGFGLWFEASEIVKANNLTDKIVVIHGRVEDIEVEEKVDVIISEWMGYMLLYESMLPSVLFARDKWLKPGGLILPSHATLFMAPITNSDRYEGSVDFWCDVYGIDMSALVPLAKKFASEEPSIELIGGENVISWPFVVKHIDCYTFTVEEFKSVAATYKVSSMVLAPIHGFGLWFEVEFNGPAESSQNLSSNVVST